MGLFSGLEALGLKIKDIEIYEKAETKGKKTEQVEKPKEQVVHNEADYLFRKTHKCPICDNQFKSLAVRVGKIRAVGQDEDLRPVYKEFDPLKYEPVVCPDCGYASLERYFDSMMPLQAKYLREGVKSSFTGMNDGGTETYSYDTAIMRYKMVLYSDVAGKVKNSRKAYTCLKMSWVIRGKLENESEQLSQKDRDDLKETEQECVEKAYEGYCLAFSSETFPMSGMDELTVLYLVAGLAFRLEKYREALQFLSRIMGNHNASTRIKNRALELKEKIREKVDEQ